ncbi:hypothetical protein CAPTEDRAFT_175182, partial [Capitella teleta]
MMRPTFTMWRHLANATHRNFSVVTPAKVSVSRPLPTSIPKPPYLSPGFFIKNILSAKNSKPEIKNLKQISGMRASCALASDILKRASELARPGVTTEDIDEFVMSQCIEHEAYPSPLLYKGFPKSVCTSVNNVACHGIPDDRPLQDGDIINIDITVFYKGFHGDTSATFPVGTVDAEAEFLIQVARECRDNAISICGPGVQFNQIGNAVMDTAEMYRFEVVPDFIGHGIGDYFHGAPDVLHFRNEVTDEMKEGMTFTIEPIVSEGSAQIAILSDGWTAVSLDDSRSAQFEHTVLVTADGVEILTQ